MRSEQLNDNYAEALRTISSYVLRNAPRGMKEHSRLQIEAQMECFRGYPTFTRGKGTECNIDWEFRSDESILDENGNRWYSYKFETAVGFPSWGNQGPETVLIQGQLLTEAATFAMELSRMVAALFPEIWHLAQTKAERDAEEQTRLLQESERKAKEFIRANFAGLRVGGTKAWSWTGSLTRLSEGKYADNFGGRIYELSVEDAGVVLKRVS